MGYIGKWAAQGGSVYTYTGFAIAENSWLQGWPGFSAPSWTTGAIVGALTSLFSDPDSDHDISHPVLGDITIHRLRAGIERFFISDIDNPTGSAHAQSALTVEWSVLSTAVQDFNHISGGSNILYMDGHVSYIRYPSDQFPVSEEMARIAASAS